MWRGFAMKQGNRPGFRHVEVPHPAKVLALVRDRKVARVQELCGLLGFFQVLSIPGEFERLERELGTILNDLAAAGLVTQDGEKLAPTELITKIQKALRIGLTNLSEGSEQAEPGDR